MGELDFLLTKTVGEETQESASAVLTAIKDSPGCVKEVLSMLHTSMYCRDIAPLLLSGLSQMYVRGHSHESTIEDIFALLPTVCRPVELHSLSLETWIELWGMTCECTLLNSECQLTKARSLVAQIIITIIRNVEKGPLLRNRENYVLSIAGQLLSKFLIPETERPLHSISLRWITCVTDICDILCTLVDQDKSDATTQANAEISLRMMAGLLECQLLHSGSLFDVEEGFNLQALNYVTPHQLLLSTLCSKLPCISGDKESPSETRSADFELEDNDIALFVLASHLKPKVSPRIVPMLWSYPKRFGVSIQAARCLLRSRHPVLGARLSVSLLEDNHVTSCPQSLCGLWLEELIVMATSYGDENVMSLESRRNVFACMSKAVMGWDCGEACSTLVCIIGRCKSDSTVGIFVKLLKDLWAKNNLSVDLFHQVVKLTCASEYQVLDGIDTLKSILNWARLVYLRSPPSLTESDLIFLNFVKDVLNRVRIELKLVANVQDPESAMKRTRLEFIGHLASRVCEILETAK